MATLVYADNAHIREIEEIYNPMLVKASPFTPFFPQETDDADLLIWEQQDFAVGLQQWRGLDGMPPRVNRLKINQFMAQPGYYGEHIVINETEITKRRQVGTFGTPIDITEPQVRAQKQLLIRRNTLIQKLLSDLCCIGLYQVAAADGTIVKAAGFAVRTFTATFPWSTFATSTPLADFTAISFFGRGVSADFGARAVAIMNRTTFANLRQNTNQSDLAGRRQGGFGGINNLTDINTLFTGDGLPMIVLYDGVWFDDARVMHLFIPDNTVVILAPRDTGTRIGAYRMTRNAVNPGAAPGAYARVVDRGAMGQIPPTVEVHDGHNGGPILEFGSSIAVMHV